MKQLVQEFSTQLQEALIIGQSYKFNTAKREFRNVVLTGLGGSGIGGSIVQNYVFDSLKVPFVVNKDYFLPAFVDKDTLVIACSYSGNTEETVMALKAAVKAKATIICITSGGAIAETAKKKNFDCILVPAGMPPRACLGYSLVQVLYTLAHFGLISNGFEREIKAAIKLLQNDAKELEREGKALAKKLDGKTPIIYAAPDFEGVAVRFRQQINENGKMLAWHHVVPEMNHNELVGWRDKDNNRAVVILRNENDFERVQTRFELNKQIIKKYTKSITEVYSRGNSYWEKVFSLVHLTDWCSVYLAEMHGVDATEVKVIDFLKGELAKEA